MVDFILEMLKKDYCFAESLVCSLRKDSCRYLASIPLIARCYAASNKLGLGVAPQLSELFNAIVKADPAAVYKKILDMAEDLLASSNDLSDPLLEIFALERLATADNSPLFEVIAARVRR